jgi:hypothetical protein
MNDFAISNIGRLKDAITKALAIPENSAPSLLEGRVTKIEDPEFEGRCKLALGYFTLDSGDGYETDWVRPLNFQLKGLLPSYIVGQQVLVSTINNSYENIRVNIPTNWLRYTPDKLPSAEAKNHGLQVIILKGQESFSAVCLQRNGRYTWEILSPLYHLHLSGDTIFQGIDAGGNIQQPIQPVATSDMVVVTSVTPYIANTAIFPPIVT